MDLSVLNLNVRREWTGVIIGICGDDAQFFEGMCHSDVGLGTRPPTSSPLVERYVVSTWYLCMY